MTRQTQRILIGAFYGGLGVLLLLVVTGALAALVPSLASRVSYNSEAYLFALVLGAWIQFGLPRLPEGKRLGWAFGIGGVWALIGIGLLLSDLPSRIRTLNEPALALAILIPYVAFRRPISRWFVAAVTPVLAALTVWAVIWSPESWIIDQAETFAFVALAVITFDLIDRPLLEPGAPVHRGCRWTWYVFMLVEPIVVSALGTAIRADENPLGLLLRYLGRVHESFLGVLLVALILHLVKGYRTPPASTFAMRRESAS